jgi:hypothetical protein
MSEICSGYISASDHLIFKSPVCQPPITYLKYGERVKNFDDQMIKSWYLVRANFLQFTKGHFLGDIL